MAISLIISFLFGSMIGSFLNVLILRLPHQKSLGGRSHCPICKRTLTAFDLIPIFSYLALRGNCRGCGERISSRYVIIELVTGILFALAFFVISPVWSYEYFALLRVWFIIATLIVVFVVDLEHFLILDTVVYRALAVTLLSNIVLDVWRGTSLLSLSSLTLGGIVAALLPFGALFVLWYLSKGKWIGFGDVKFMLFLGAALTLPAIGVGLFVSFVLGGIIGIGLLVFGNKTMQSKLPLGTFLSVGTLVALLWGNALLSWYLGLIGIA